MQRNNIRICECIYSRPRVLHTPEAKSVLFLHQQPVKMNVGKVKPNRIPQTKQKKSSNDP